MAALCQAVETKDLHTRGHSERVSRGAVMIGREIGFLDEALAAIMHGTRPRLPGQLQWRIPAPQPRMRRFHSERHTGPAARRPGCSQTGPRSLPPWG
jgi:hypothetical protein